MRPIFVIIHVTVSVALILIVLLQKGKGANIGAAFGGSSQTVFGSTGATPFLHKVTVGAAVIFMITSLTLAFLFGRGAPTSVMKGVKQPVAPVTQQTEAPASGAGQGEQK